METPSPTAETPLAVLLLEDFGLIRSGMHRLIVESEPRAQVTEAGSYQAAVDALERQPFAIAFLDHDLRDEKTGLDLLKWIREQDMLTRVIMLSGEADEALVMTCLKEGAAGYICKDLDSDGMFRRALDAVLQGSVFLPSGVLGRRGFSPSQVRPTTATAASLGLTGRTFEALYYASQGLAYKTIARAMNIEEATVRQEYMPKLFRAFAVRSRADLQAELARRALIIPKPD
ncbi:response regulator [Sphingomonas sp.]|uniref:response regulator n=1 Tax=Sphingomonas sp. TaxID=28214 RepID=UPI003CC54484